jgi:hypothetical protein
MAFTDERILELAVQHGFVGLQDSDGVATFSIDTDTIKVYHATYSALTKVQKHKNYLTDTEAQMWSTVLFGKDIYEVVFSADPELKDEDSKYTEISE